MERALIFFSHQSIDSFLHLNKMEAHKVITALKIIQKIVQSITKLYIIYKFLKEKYTLLYIYKFGNLELNKWMHSGNDVARVLARATQQDFYRKSVIFIWCQHQKLGIIKLIWKTQPANHMYNVCTMLHSILVCTLHNSVGHYTDIWLGVYYVMLKFYFN